MPLNVMRWQNALFALAAACALQAMPALADAPPRMMIPNSLIGVWAGEGISCTARRDQLHLYRRERTLHPRIYPDDIGYACMVVNVRGHGSNFRIRSRCRAFGMSAPRRERPTMQTVKLSEQGQRMEIEMFDTSDGSPLRREHLYRCSGGDQQHRQPRRTP